MNELFCEREHEVSAALRSGDLDPELLDHTVACRVCADVIAVTRFLQNEALNASQFAVPDASVIWKKAEARSRQAAVARATRPIQFVMTLASVAVAVTGLWLILQAKDLMPFLSTLFKLRLLLDHFWSGDWAEFALFGGVSSLICALVGTFYLLRVGEKDHRLASSWQ